MHPWIIHRQCRCIVARLKSGIQPLFRAFATLQRYNGNAEVSLLSSRQYNGNADVSLCRHIAISAVCAKEFGKKILI